MDTTTASEGCSYHPQLEMSAQAEKDDENTEQKGGDSSLDRLDTRRSHNARALSRIQAHFVEEISTTHADIPMLICCLISGLVDSTIYNAYGTFVSMQTGSSGTPSHSYP